MAENFPNLWKEIDPNPGSSETYNQDTFKEIHTNAPYNQMLNIKKKKEENHKSSKRKTICYMQGHPIRPSGCSA